MAISQPTATRFMENAPIFAQHERVNTGKPVFVVEGHLNFTAAGFTSAAAGDITLVKLPPGKIRILNDLSYISCPAGTATSDLDVGLAAYTKADGTTQALQGAVLADSLDVGGGAIAQHLPLPTGGTGLIVDSRDGVNVVCSFDTANSPASGVLQAKIVYQREN